MSDKFWKYILIAFLFIILCITVHKMNSEYQIRMLVENSKVNPIEAKCAINSQINEAACIIKAQK